MPRTPHTLTILALLSQLGAAAPVAPLNDKLQEELASALAPCRIQSTQRVHWPRLPAEEPTIQVEAKRPNHPHHEASSLIAAVTLVYAKQTHRLPVSLRVQCPAPALSAGAAVRIRVKVGNVVASAPGHSQQAGHPGDTVRVHNDLTRAAVLARVVDAQTVEVVP